MALAKTSGRQRSGQMVRRPSGRRVSVASCWSLWHANSSSLSGVMSKSVSSLKAPFLERRSVQHWRPRWRKRTDRRSPRPFTGSGMGRRVFVNTIGVGCGTRQGPDRARQPGQDARRDYGPGGPERTFRYASLSSGLEIVRKILGHHEIATCKRLQSIKQPVSSI
jgi:hypothetical protein